MPYRIDFRNPPDDALDRLVALGALDVELVPGGLAALVPDGLAPTTVEAALGTDIFSISPARARDGGSTWILSPRPIRAGGLLIVPPDVAEPANALRLCDGPAFGTGLHPTTALCLDALETILQAPAPPRVLDIGTGSGVLALAALMLGVERAIGIDIDAEALGVAAENARLNGLSSRFSLVCGGPESVGGAWPIVLANVLAAPLMEMAPAVSQRVAHGGRLVLSGIPVSVAADVGRNYRNLGMRAIAADTRAGWTALVFAPSW